MAKLPKSIIAKYGITKKAWAVFRGRKKGGGHTMAKKKNKGSKNRSGMPAWAGALIGDAIALGYGAVRPKLADKIPAVPKVENYSDELILGGTSMAVYYLVPNKYARMVSRPIKTVELSKIGEKMAAKVPLSNK